MLVTSCPGIGRGQWGQILHHIMHHAHSGFLLSQRNSHCSTFMKYKTYLVKYNSACIISVPVFVSLPAGLTCLKEVAAAIPRAFFNSRTSCQAFRASHRLMKPGEPLTTERMQYQ